MIQKLKKYRIWIGCIAVIILIVVLAVLMMTRMVSKGIEVTVNGETKTYKTTEATVDGFLKAENIRLGKLDKVTPARDKWLSDGAEINILKAVPFTVQADGETRKLEALPDMIGDVLEDYDILLGKDDRVTPALNQPLTAGTEIVINRIVTKTEEETVKTDYEVETREDDSLAAGATEVVQEGKKGTDKITYKAVYSDGKLEKRTKLSRETVTEPRNKIIKKGVRRTIEGRPYTKKFTVKAYSYSGGGRTALGTPARVGEIAVDPSVIPLGTKVYVEGYGFATAEDTGGNIKGETIDVYLNSESASNRWGVRYVTIYILQ